MSDELAHVYARAFQSQLEETTTTLQCLQGSLPKALRGHFYRIGPGRMQRGNLTYAHPVDGDGMIACCTFSDKGVHYRNRHIRTDEFRREEQQDQPLYRYSGTALPGDTPKKWSHYVTKNPANTNIIWHAGKLLALGDGGLPYWIDPLTLETLARYDFSGRLQGKYAWLSVLSLHGLPFSAHPKKLANDDNLYGFGVRYGLMSRLLLYRVDSLGRLKITRNLRMQHNHFIHDAVITPHYQVFFLNPAQVENTLDVTLNRKTLIGSFESSPPVQGEILIVPRDGQSSPRRIQGISGVIIHAANGYEAGPGTLIIDAPRWDRFPCFGNLQDEDITAVFDTSGPRMTRFSIDLDTGLVTEQQLAEQQVECPTINPQKLGQPHRYIWSCGLTRCYGDTGACRIVRFDTLEGSQLERDFSPDVPSEPTMVPAPNGDDEDDGWLITLVYRVEQHCTDMLVLSARDLSTVCQYRLPHHLPPGFHNCWVGAHHLPV